MNEERLARWVVARGARRPEAGRLWQKDAEYATNDAG
jgi:hypothetical protein